MSVCSGSRALKRWVVCIVVVLLGTVACSWALPGVARAATTPTVASIPSYEQGLVSLINQYRRSHGLPALLVSDALTGGARKHSSDMAKYLFFNYTSLRSDWFPVGSFASDRIAASGYKDETKVGESIGNGFVTAQETFVGWKSMSNANANMLNPNFKVIGVGVVSGGIYRFYSTADYAGGYVDSTAHAVASTAAAVTPTAKPTALVAATAAVGQTQQEQDRWGQMPLYFVKNAGQMDSKVAFYVQGSDKTLYFTPDATTFALTGEKETSPTALPTSEPDSAAAGRWVVKLDYVGADAVTPIGEAKTDTSVSYFKGSPEDWDTGLSTYSSITYPKLWPGVDLTCSGTAQQLKQEFLVQPGADAGKIELAYKGATVKLGANGQLEVTTPMGGFTDDAPFAYQEIDGVRVPVDVAFSVRTPTDKDQDFCYGFKVGAYDHSLPLVIDPAVLVYCGVIGSTGYEFATDVAVDSAGCAYITGEVSSRANFPVSKGPDLSWNGGLDAFVAKIKADGSGLVYLGYLGGSGTDSGTGITVDAQGYAYFAGWTTSTQATFPVVGGPDRTYNSSTDAFVAKVRPDGTGLVYAGYIGGSRQDFGMGIALDSQGCAYVTGLTYGNYSYSTTVLFPNVKGPSSKFGGVVDGFVAKVNATGTGFIYSGYIGGSGFDYGTGIAVDSAGCAYVTGETVSSQATFPVRGLLDPTANGKCDAFVAKVKADGTGLVYSGYIGGAANDYGLGIAVDGQGCAYVVGTTNSFESTFPVLGGPDRTYNRNGDAFLTKVKADGSGVVYSGYIGGGDFDYGASVAVDAAGSAYVTGTTRSSQATFPVAGGPDLTYNGNDDGFVAKVKPDGTGLLYAGYVGGSSNGTFTGLTGNDYSLGIAVDAKGSAYVTGETGSSATSFPVIAGLDHAYHGRRVDEVFVAKISSRPVIASVGPASGLTTGGPVVTISGTDLSGVTSVKFGATAATNVHVVSSTKLTATAPAHVAGRVDVTVTSAQGTSTATGAGNDYTYYSRYQESSSLFYYKLAWKTSAYAPENSGGYIRTSSATGAVRFKFTGTAFRLVCRKGPMYGKLKVSVDFVLQSVYPDLYSSTYLNQQVVYTKTGLKAGTHTVDVGYTGFQNASSGGKTVDLDALDVCGTLVQAP